MDPKRYILLRYNTNFAWIFAICIESNQSTTLRLINSLPLIPGTMLNYVRNYAKDIANILGVQYDEERLKEA
ncbi:MAG TPA: hypothetical protein ENI52_01265 [Thermoplasmata archaeon]|nr:hypothetical protein [Thermoplasmata archaeon]